jgi:hypothetical protein
MEMRQDGVQHRFDMNLLDLWKSPLPTEITRRLTFWLTFRTQNENKAIRGEIWI